MARFGGDFFVFVQTKHTDTCIFSYQTINETWEGWPVGNWSNWTNVTMTGNGNIYSIDISKLPMPIDYSPYFNGTIYASDDLGHSIQSQFFGFRVYGE